MKSCVDMACGTKMRLQKFKCWSPLLAIFLVTQSLWAAEVKILSLNTRFLKVPLGVELADDIESRLKKMPQAISDTGADVVGMQEVWDPKIRKNLVSALKALGYTYSVFKDQRSGAPRGLMGNGLLIVSKFPLDQSVSSMSFSDYTRKDEYLTYKGAIKTRVKLPDLGWTDLYNTHLGAITFDEDANEYVQEQEEIKLHQAKELADWIKATRTQSEMIMTADLNAHYLRFEDGRFGGKFSDVYFLLTYKKDGLTLVDTYRQINRGYFSSTFTFNAANPYVSRGSFSNIPSEVEDYILVSRSKRLSVIHSEVTFSGKEELISDHYGVLTTLKTVQ